MNKTDLPSSLQKGVDKEGLSIFLKEVNISLKKGNSKLAAYIKGFRMLKKVGYEKINNQWVKKENSLKIKLEKIQKQDEEKRQIFGFFSIVEMNGEPVVDSQGDVILEKDLEESAYRYVKNSRMGDESHDYRCKAILIESMLFTKEKQNALGIDLGYSGWWGGFEIKDTALWEKVKSGEYEGFSIGGMGKSERIA